MARDLQSSLIQGVNHKTDDDVTRMASCYEQHVYDSPATDPWSVAIELPPVFGFGRYQTRRAGKKSAECDATLQLSAYSEW